MKTIAISEDTHSILKNLQRLCRKKDYVGCNMDYVIYEILIAGFEHALENEDYSKSVCISLEEYNKLWEDDDEK